MLQTYTKKVFAHAGDKNQMRNRGQKGIPEVHFEKVRRNESLNDSPL